jgi:hypothetical protein
MKKLSNTHVYWQLTALVVIMALALSACGGATPTTVATEVPTTAPTEEPTMAAIATVIQDFETSATPYTDGDSTTASLGDMAYTGTKSLKSESSAGEWHTVGVNLSTAPVDLTPYNRVCFWVYDTTAFNNGMAANTVGVTLIDASGAKVQRYSDNEGVGANPKTRLNSWVPMCMNLISFTGIDQTKVEKIEFTMYWAGVYSFDDITLLPADAEAPAPTAGAGDKMYAVNVQGFEAEDSYYSDYQANLSLSTEIFHGGASSLMETFDTGEWHAFGAYPNPNPIDLSKFNKLCFWIYDTSEHEGKVADNTVGVKLFDETANEEVWTDNTLAGTNPKTAPSTWTQMCINLAAFTTVDLSKITKVQFSVYWAGTYYVDDIQAFGTVEAASEAAVVQDFEKEDTYYADYQANLSLATDIFHGGASSLKETFDTGEWHAFGAYPEPRPFDALPYSKVCFWIYDTSEHEGKVADNTVGVKLFDASGASEEVWTDNALGGTNPKTAANDWTQLCINLAAYTTIDLSKIDKVQLSLYWAGTYYVDDITFEP